MANDLAALFLYLMPVAFGVKTVVFFILAIILFRQVARTPLGRWLTAFMASTMLASLVVTELVWYLTRIADPQDVNTIEEWLIVVGSVVAPALVVTAGLMVTISNFRITPDDTECS